MRIKNLLSLFFVVVFITACATANKMNKLSLGMTKAEVINSLGSPNSVSAQAGVEYLMYELSPTDDMAFYGVTRPYFVRVINGKVESYGLMGDFDSSKDPTININKTNK
tara:strand:- start:265 stop:591 length:327 start_codon:yes stop_codon:yes gene_type:complete